MANAIPTAAAPLSRSADQMQAHYDVIVVGSGYGGGVSASRLSRAGQRVAVIERGKEFVTGSFPQRLPELRRELQVSGGKMRIGDRRGLFDVRLGEDLHVLMGCGLGGGSLINAGVALRPDDRVFEDDAWPGQIRQDGLLDEGYRRARAWLRPATDDGARGRPKFKALDRASPAVGPRPEPAEVVISFDDTQNAAGLSQSACTRCGDCCSGCNIGAKNTVALTYLADAVAEGAEVFTEVSVDRVAKDGGVWTVHFKADPKASDGVALVSVTADTVILAAGSLGSTEILLRSKSAGLAVSDRVGDKFSANGDIIAFGYGATEPVNAIGTGNPAPDDVETVGASVSGQIRVQNAERLSHEMYIQEGVLPSPIAPLLPIFFVPGGRLLGAAQSLFKGVYKGPLNHLHTFFVVSHDSGSGRMVIEDDRLKVKWPGAENEPVNARVDTALEDLVTANGGDYIKSPLSATSVGSKPATAHPLGGCAMANDRDHGVVNHKGQVFSAEPGAADTAVHSGLYVMDGSIMPRSLGCNPLLTITALAERAMLHMARDKGLEFDADARGATAAINI